MCLVGQDLACYTRWRIMFLIFPSTSASDPISSWTPLLNPFSFIPSQHLQSTIHPTSASTVHHCAKDMLKQDNCLESPGRWNVVGHPCIKLILFPQTLSHLLSVSDILCFYFKFPTFALHWFSIIYKFCTLSTFYAIASQLILVIEILHSQRKLRNNFRRWLTLNIAPITTILWWVHRGNNILV